MVLKLQENTKKILNENFNHIIINLRHFDSWSASSTSHLCNAELSQANFLYQSERRWDTN